jgi:hypothetical protein
MWSTMVMISDGDDLGRCRCRNSDWPPQATLFIAPRNPPGKINKSLPKFPMELLEIYYHFSKIALINIILPARSNELETPISKNANFTYQLRTVYPVERRKGFKRLYQ